MNPSNKLCFALVAALLTACSSPKKTVVVNFQEAPTAATGYRSPERQRDLWVAPQANEESLNHEQLITFIEKPGAWKIPSTIEPNAVSGPELPIQEGEYDDAVLERQRQLLENEKKKSAQLENQLTQIQGNTEQKLKEIQENTEQQLKAKEDLVQLFKKQQTAADTRLQEVAGQLEAQRKELEARKAAEREAKEKEVRERAAKEKEAREKPWWKFW